MDLALRKAPSADLRQILLFSKLLGLVRDKFCPSIVFQCHFKVEFAVHKTPKPLLRQFHSFQRPPSFLRSFLRLCRRILALFQSILKDPALPSAPWDWLKPQPWHFIFPLFPWLPENCCKFKFPPISIEFCWKKSKNFRPPIRTTLRSFIFLKTFCFSLSRTDTFTWYFCSFERENHTTP